MFEPESSSVRRTGIIACFAVFVIEILYALTLTAGLLDLKSPDDPISDPFFSILEFLILLMMPSLLAAMVCIHASAPADKRGYSLIAVAFMALVCGITSSVHFVVWTVSRQIADGFPWSPLFLSFKWPSVIYALDILAWDWFFPLSVLFAAPIFSGNRLNLSIRYFLVLAGVLSLVGLIGIPLSSMQIRMIGVVGYVPVAAVAFFLVGIAFVRHSSLTGEAK